MRAQHIEHPKQAQCGAGSRSARGVKACAVARKADRQVRGRGRESVSHAGRNRHGRRLVRPDCPAGDHPGVPSEPLEIEIAEGTMMKDQERGMETLTALPEIGLRIAIDDFGTAYSSLSCVKTLSDRHDQDRQELYPGV